MKKAIYLSILFFVAGVALARSESALPAYVPGEVIVKFRTSASVGALSAMGYDSVAVVSQDAGNVALVKTREYQTVDNAIAEFHSRGDVEFAQPNYIYRGQFLPNDPSLQNQYYLRNTNVLLTWRSDTGTSLAGETVAVVDSGGDTDHGDIAAHFVLDTGIDIIDGDADPTDEGGSGHGMAVSGVIGAIQDNDTMIAGIDGGARILPVRVLTGINATGSTLDVDSGIRYAISRGARVINLSLGFESGSSVDPLLEAAITAATDAGIVVVAAAGNTSGSPIIYPANSTKTIAVGATDQNNARASFSSFGAPSSSLRGIDVMAPGVGLRTLGLNNSEASSSGTSFSTPIVSAFMAMVRGRRAALTPEELRTYLRSTADDIGSAGWDEQTGAGLANLFRLMAVATSDPEYPDSTLAFDTATTQADGANGRRGEIALPILSSDSYAGYNGLHGTESGSIQFYFKPTATQATGSISAQAISSTETHYILTQRGNLTRSTGHIDIILRADQKIEARIHDSATVISSITVNPAQWYQIALSYDTTNISLFVNGNIDSVTYSATPGPAVSADTIFLGVPVSFGNATPAFGYFSKVAFDTVQRLLFPSAMFVQTLAPAATASVSSSFNVSWQAYMSETNPLRISIYADTDNTGLDGTLIVSNTANDQRESISPDSLTLGQTFFFYTIASDASSTEQAFSYSPAALTIVAPASVVVAPGAGGSGGGCLLSQVPADLSVLRRWRDSLNTHLAGRVITHVYYLFFG